MVKRNVKKVLPSIALGSLVLLVTISGILGIAGFVSNNQVSPTIQPTSTQIVIEITPTTSQLQTPASTPTIVQSSKSGPSYLYPNPTLTPEEVFNVTSSQVCVSGYTTTVRDVPLSEKEQVYAEYGVSYPQATGVYEVDHFIPLELGGDNNIKNLWLEPANPAPGFHQKDAVENYLHKLVCNGSLSLAEAQNEISSDWYKVYLSTGGSTATTNTVNPTSNVIAPIPVVTSSVVVGQATGLCNDGTLTYTVNHQGACSHHSGVKLWY